MISNKGEKKHDQVEGYFFEFCKKSAWPTQCAHSIIIQCGIKKYKCVRCGPHSFPRTLNNLIEHHMRNTHIVIIFKSGTVHTKRNQAEQIVLYNFPLFYIETSCNSNKYLPFYYNRVNWKHASFPMICMFAIRITPLSRK